MFFFKKKSDPLAEEMRQLDEEQRQLDQAAADIEYALQNPPAPEPPPADSQKSKGARFVHDPLPVNDSASPKRARLKIQRSKARRRVLWLCLGLLFVGLCICRCAGTHSS